MIIARHHYCGGGLLYLDNFAHKQSYLNAG